MREAINLNFKYARVRPNWLEVVELTYGGSDAGLHEAAPAESIVEVGEARVKPSHRREPQVAIDVLEGNTEEIEKQ